MVIYDAELVKLPIPCEFAGSRIADYKYLATALLISLKYSISYIWHNIMYIVIYVLIKTDVQNYWIEMYICKCSNLIIYLFLKFIATKIDL